MVSCRGEGFLSIRGDTDYTEHPSWTVQCSPGCCLQANVQQNKVARMMTAHTKLTQTGGECTQSPEGQAPNSFPVRDESIMNLDICDLAKSKRYHWLMCTSGELNAALIHLKEKDLEGSQLERMQPETDLNSLRLFVCF